MKVTVEDKSTVKKILHIEIPQEDVTREVDSAYAQVKKTAKIKGFRPGKAPRSVLAAARTDLRRHHPQGDVFGW